MSATDVQQKVFRIPGNVIVSLGLYWDFIGFDPVDLDLSAVCFTETGQFLDVVFFNHLFPNGVDEAKLRSSYLVDPDTLPYMFLSGDSTLGGEEENQTSGAELARRRRRQRELARQGLFNENVAVNKHDLYDGSNNNYIKRHKRRGQKYTKMPSFAVAAMANIFNRVYEEEELEEVQQTLDTARHPAENGIHGKNSMEENASATNLSQRESHRELADEVLTFVMHKIPPEAAVIFICVTSYSGADFTILPHVKLVLYNETTNERVGMIDLKAATGNGTANLACMLHRVPNLSIITSTETNAKVKERKDEEALTTESNDAAGQSSSHSNPENANRANTANTDANTSTSMSTAWNSVWDLRELNLSTFGYTFVDVLPLMQEMLGTPKHSQRDALHHLPDYSLQKKKAIMPNSLLSSKPQEVNTFLPPTSSSPPAQNGKEENLQNALSDVRLGVGWSGDFDLDAFLVMFDRDNNYVDHVYPKFNKLQFKLNNVLPVAQHSGDALSGDETVGDNEFVDLITYRLPAEVCTVMVGATFMENFNTHASSHHNRTHKTLEEERTIYEIPQLYLRLQNRTLRNPYSTEVDRWNVHESVTLPFSQSSETLTTKRTDVIASAIDKVKHHKQHHRKESIDDDDNGIKNTNVQFMVERTYKAEDGSMQPVRTLLLGVLVRTGTEPLQNVFPGLQGANEAEVRALALTFLGSHLTSVINNTNRDGVTTTATTSNNGDGDVLHIPIPTFEYIPLHQHIPADPRSGINTLIPFLQFVANYTRSQYNHKLQVERLTNYINNNNINTYNNDGTNRNDNDSSDDPQEVRRGGALGDDPLQSVFASLAEESNTHQNSSHNIINATSSSSNIPSQDGNTSAHRDGNPANNMSSTQAMPNGVQEQQTSMHSSHANVEANQTSATTSGNSSANNNDDNTNSTTQATHEINMSANAREATNNNTATNNVRQNDTVKTTTTSIHQQRQYEHHIDKINFDLERHPLATKTIAVCVQFVEILELEPQLPQKFKCHGEAWVCNRSFLHPSSHSTKVLRPSSSVETQKVFKTPFLLNRDALRWDKHNPATIATFVVHCYDRIKVMIYEYASFGIAEIDLLHFPQLWESDQSLEQMNYIVTGQQHRTNTLRSTTNITSTEANVSSSNNGDNHVVIEATTNRYNSISNEASTSAPIELVLDLCGGGSHLSKGKVKVLLWRTSYTDSLNELQDEQTIMYKQRKLFAKNRLSWLIGEQNVMYKSCSVM